MMTEVLEDVTDGVHDLPQRLQYVRVEPVREYLPCSPIEVVQRASQPDGEPLDGAREHGRLVCFDNEMDVISLDRVMHHPHSEAQLDLAQSILDGASAAERPQEARTGQQSHRYVDWVPRLEPRSAH